MRTPGNTYIFDKVERVAIQTCKYQEVPYSVVETLSPIKVLRFYRTACVIDA